MKKRIPSGLTFKCVQVDSLPAKLFFEFKKAKGLQAALNGRESDFR
jgi:hypothetical protein